MDLSNFLAMRQEVGLMAVFLIIFLLDIFTTNKRRPYFSWISYSVFALYTVFSFIPMPEAIAFGGMYETTTMTSIMKGILSLGTLIVFLQAQKWLRLPHMQDKAGEFYLLTIATLLGMFMMISSRNFMMTFIAVEMASLPLACIAALNKYRVKSAEAGAKYILISAFSSAILMFGISLLYGASGSLYFEDMTGIISTPLSILGLVFFFAGLGFKISIVPFHLWTADVYEGAPTNVTAYLSVVSKGAAAFAMFFALHLVFQDMKDVWHIMIWVLTVLTITVGNLFAIRQKDLKRFFAFSSISQAGYILLGVIAGTDQGLAAIVYYVLVYLFSNLAIFGVLAALEKNSENLSFSSISGLYKSNPKLGALMTLAVFSLAGIPPFAGFMSKFFIFASAIEQGEYILVFIALLNTIISLYYYLLVVKAIFITPQSELSVITTRTDTSNKISLVVCLVGILAVGIVSMIHEYLFAIA